MMLERYEHNYSPADDVSYKIVVRFDDNYESWRKLVIVRREDIVKRIQYLRSIGFRYGQIERWDYLPYRAFSSAGSGGPGEVFANEPFVVRRDRKFVVYMQTGGIDV